MNAEEKQITFTPRNHELDNNDNFSADGRYLCFDTRETFAPGIDGSRSIEKVDLVTGKETVLYSPPFSTGDHPGPGVGAASFSPVADKVCFIHGPPLEAVAARGPYAKTNRNGAEVSADGSGKLAWLDERDVATTRDTLPGAHRGGTHRHEYSGNGKRIGFTYDDALITDYDRTIGYMEPNPKAPGKATHYFALLVPVAPKGKSRPGEIERAWDDSWIGREGLMRGFIGKVRSADGVNYDQSLFVADVPADVDITTADSGSATRFPSPPKGLKIRRLTTTYAAGNVRGSLDGTRIAYYALDASGLMQVFIIPANGSEGNPNPFLRPKQATEHPQGAGPGLRWHPSGNAIFCASLNGIAATCVNTGAAFGKTIFLTPPDSTVEPAPQPPGVPWSPALQGYRGSRTQLAVSPKGDLLAFDRPVAMTGSDGKPLKSYNGKDFTQIFTLNFTLPDSWR